VLSYLLRRVLSSAVTIMLVTMIIFVIIRVVGDPTHLMLPPDATQADRDLLRRTMGLDRPLAVQYLEFLIDVAVGDFGLSYRFSQPAMDVVLDRLGHTAILTVTALALAATIGIPLGVLSAVYRDGWIDVLARTFAVVGQSAPPFLFGLLFVALFSVKLGLLPTSGAGGPLHLVMPAAALGWYSAAGIMRLCRSSMSEVLETEYIKMARIKGVPGRLVIFKHALSNACLPVITFAALQLGVLLGGAVSIEAVFAWPGLGQLILKSIDDLDYTVVQAAVTLIAVGFAVINLLVDVVYAWVDPRIRYD
jgi:peptide/nickel transport system permease protein